MFFLATGRKNKKMSDHNKDEFVFVALGGLGQIGMNAALYGFGPKQKRKWLMVDCGVSFAGPDLPGIDLVMPDVSFLESVKKDLVGIIITHAHEDHIGAVVDLWPKLGVQLYATRFAAGLLSTKRLSEPGAPPIPIAIMAPGQRLDLAPFEVEIVNVAHSIPESCALAIRTPAGMAVHTGDWKIDDTPVTGLPTDTKRFQELGEEGVLALICDSTNIMREGTSPSETDVAKTLHELLHEAKGRVVVTTFASNIARIRAVAEAAMASGRSVVVAGRAMDRAIAVARECGYMDGIAEFLPLEHYSMLPRQNIAIVATGSQGEPRAALARISEDQHPVITLASGDKVIFSSRTIPGNEKPVGRIINGLVDQNIEVITDRTCLVHVSGHPRRAEVAQMYDWLRPKIAIPAHGEPMHLNEHMAFAKARGVETVLRARNGDLVLLGTVDGSEKPGVVNQIRSGRMFKDGDILVSETDEAVKARVKLSFAGVITIAFALNSKGDLAGDPDVVLTGIPARSKQGMAMDEIVDKAIFSTIDNLPRAKRRDADAASEAVEKAVRAAVGAVWGKKPQVIVLVIEV